MHLLPVTDAAVLSTIVDGTVVIVGAGTTTREQLAKSMGVIEHVKGRLLGLVLNKVPRKGPDAYAYYRAGYASAPARENAKRKAQLSGPRPDDCAPATFRPNAAPPASPARQGVSPGSWSPSKGNGAAAWLMTST